MFLANILFLIAQKDSWIKIGCYRRSAGSIFVFLGSSIFFQGLLEGAPKKIKVKIDEMLSYTLIWKVTKFRNVFIKHILAH